MSTLEHKRKKLELLRVQTAKQELEFKIEERMEEIQRIKEHIEITNKREKELIIEIEKGE